MLTYAGPSNNLGNALNEYNYTSAIYCNCKIIIILCRYATRSVRPITNLTPPGAFVTFVTRSTCRQYGACDTKSQDIWRTPGDQ